MVPEPPRGETAVRRPGGSKESDQSHGGPAEITPRPETFDPPEAGEGEHPREEPYIRDWRGIGRGQCLTVQPRSRVQQDYRDGD